jgi:PAS domain S-box-containing protein
MVDVRNEATETQTETPSMDTTMSQNDQLLRAARCSIFLLDEDCCFLSVDSSIQSITGYTPEALMGTSYYDLIAPEWQEELRQTVCLQQQGAATAETHREFPLQTADGAVCWVRHTALLQKTEDQTYYRCMIQDITSLKQTERALTLAERRNHALLDALPDMMMVVSRDGLLTGFHVSMDEGSMSLEGESSIHGRSLSDLGLSEAITDDFFMHLELVLEIGGVQTFEFQLPAGDSKLERDFFEVRMTAVNEDEALVLVRNISPLKQIQQELRQHIETLHTVREVGIELSENLEFAYVAPMALDAAQRLSNANSGFLAMMGEEPEILSVIGSYDTQAVLDALKNPTGIIARVLENQQTEFITDVDNEPGYQRFVPDAKALIVVPLRSRESLMGLLYLEARSAERFNEERLEYLRLITGRIAAFLDNARLYRQTQEQLEELQKVYDAVSQLEQLKTDMIRIASHDLKNPLAAILGYVEMMTWDNEESLDTTQREYLNNIETAAKKMQRITSSILSLERIKQMAQQTSRERIDVAELVRRTVSEQMDFAVRFQHEIHRVVPEQTIEVAGDAIQLHEALSNIINNAIKYTPKQGRIDVSVTVTKDQVQIRVKDTGFGIPEEKQDRLFAPFYRATTNETKNIEGTGLGLHLVKNIIERHGGSMYFHSVYGEGSTFGFDLPLWEENIA